MFAVFIIVTFVFAFWIVMVVHELAHAAAALMFSPGEVTMILGSYGDRANHLRFSLGRLRFSLRRNPLTWTFGCCVHVPAISTGRELLITIAGPVVPLLVAIPVVIIAFAVDGAWALQWFALLFGLAAIIGLLVNLTPSTPTTSASGGHASDGQRVRRIWRRRRHREAIEHGAALIAERRYAEAADVLVPIAASVRIDADLYLDAVSACYLANDFERASWLAHEVYEAIDFDTNAYFSAALIEARLGRYEESLAAAEESLRLYPANFWTLCNRGYTYILMERYEDALADFDRVLELRSEESYARANRGLAALRLGRVEEGLDDIRAALAHETPSAYAHRNLGLYHLDRGERREARLCFERARALDPDTHMIDELLEAVSDA